MILDEVITGFGRTGESFASEAFKVKGDLITIAKGMIMPLAIVIRSPLTLNASEAKLSPVLPKPVITSSNIKSTP